MLNLGTSAFYGTLSDLLNYAHLCFFVSLDQLLCKKLLQQSKQGTDLFGIFLFTELPLVKGHCQSLHCFQCYCGRCTLCSFQIIKHNLSLDAKFYKYLVNVIFFSFEKKKMDVLLKCSLHLPGLFI